MRRPYLHGNIEFNNVREECSNYAAGVCWEVSINALTVRVANRITAVRPSWLQVPSYAKKWGTINFSQGAFWLNLWIQCNSFLCVDVTFIHKLFSPVRRRGKPQQTKWNNAAKKNTSTTVWTKENKLLICFLPFVPLLYLQSPERILQITLLCKHSW